MIDVQTALVNLSQSYPEIIKLVSVFAFVAGMMMILGGLYKLKIYGELRTMMASQTNLKEPLAVMCAGAMLIYLPTAFDTTMMTIFGHAQFSPLSYITDMTPNWTQSFRAVLGLVQIIGMISFIRGWFLVSKSSQQGHQGGLGKGLTHIVGGIMAMNIAGVKAILWNTFGF